VSRQNCARRWLVLRLMRQPGAVARRRLTPEEVAERENDPSTMTRSFHAHPWRAGFASGAVIAAWVLVLNVFWLIAVGLGIAVMLLTALVWRPGGPRSVGDAPCCAGSRRSQPRTRSAPELPIGS
jgi:hypothetical protein